VWYTANLIWLLDITIYSHDMNHRDSESRLFLRMVLACEAYRKFNRPLGMRYMLAVRLVTYQATTQDILVMYKNAKGLTKAGWSSVYT
jgi:hypothetical protein